MSRIKTYPYSYIFDQSCTSNNNNKTEKDTTIIKILCGNNSYPGDRFYVFLGTYSSSSFMYSPFTAFTSVSLSASNISKCPRLQLNTLCPLLRGTNNKMKLLLNIQIAPFGVVHFIQVGRRWNQRICVQVLGRQTNGRTE